MPTFDWRQRPTKNFGDVWTPFAYLELRRSDGKYESFAVQVDSGAVISLLRASVANLLGLRLQEGRRVELGSVGGNSVTAYVHDISSRFGSDIELTVPYAIAESENVPNLLGRHGIFDTLQIDFDPSLKETRVSAPWLSDGQVVVRKILIECDKHILSRWSNKALPAPGDNAARQFIRRGAQLLAAFEALLKSHRGYEAPLLVRALLEASVQFEYLMQDPAARGQLYLDFQHVTAYRQMRALIEKPVGDIANQVASSKDRAAGELRLKKEHDRVIQNFTTTTKKGKHQTWNSWYCMKFRCLAVKMKRDAEYRLWYKQCSAWAHADPFQTRNAFSVRPRAAYMAAQCYYARMLLLIAEAKRIILTADQYESLRTLNEGVI